MANKYDLYDLALAELGGAGYLGGFLAERRDMPGVSQDTGGSGQYD